MIDRMLWNASALRWPAPLKRGDRIVVTAPSSGVPAALHPRLDLVLGHLRAQGLVVEEGRCLRDERSSASAPAAARAAELMHSLLRDDVAAVFPPWGGELAIELLDRLDWAALAQAKPKWLIGYSDTSTLQVPLTLRAGWPTAHGACLMDLAPAQTEVLTTQMLGHLGTPRGGRFAQAQSRHWQRKWTDFAAQPGCAFDLTEPTARRWLNAPAGHTEEQTLHLSGRLLGGCLDTLVHLAGTPHLPWPGAGTLLFLENAELSPVGLVRALHRLRWAGWFEAGLAGVLWGRSAAPDSTAAEALRYEEAIARELGTLPCPVLVDVDIGHRPPQLLLVNGAWADVHWSAAHGGRVAQTLA
jgi:muramoyltetrapeptide carboxypeptidase LdcA involved in peptidoglycan recycling